MGWFSSSPQPATSPAASVPSTNSSPGPASTADGAYEAPDRTKRARCWDSRDAYFACLDRNNILDALKQSDDAAAKCGKEAVGFERDCVASWVKYFKQRRVAEYEKEQLLKKQEEETRRGR